MRIMLLAFATIAIIAVGANFVLGQFGNSSSDRTTGAAVRLSDS